jgi:hypothetical protein
LAQGPVYKKAENMDLGFEIKVFASSEKWG